MNYFQKVELDPFYVFNDNSIKITELTLNNVIGKRWEFFTVFLAIFNPFPTLDYKRF